MSETTPMTWEDVLKQKAAEQAMRKNAMSSGPKYISFKSGVLAIDKTPIPNNELDVVVLTFLSEHTYYKERYNPNLQQTPACWAIFDNPTKMAPHENAQTPQAASCNECPHFKWGSDPQGGRGKACKARIRLAVIPATFTTNEEVLGAELRFATLPVTSGKDFDAFYSKCQNIFGLPSFAVASKLKVVPDPKNQFKVVLEPIGRLAPEHMDAIIKRLNEAEKAIWYEYMDAEQKEVESKKL